MLIALNQIITSGGTKRVLLNYKAINYMVDKENGYGSIVYTFIGTIRVVETPQQILEIVSLKTQNKSKHEI
jgi:hypothetical protein